MPSGGARKRSGPPADPNALSAVDGEWTILPLAGRTGPAPAWPLPTQTDREAVVWVEHWALPQSVMWAATRSEYAVAAYVRQAVMCEDPECPVSRVTVLQRLRDDLGLSLTGLAHHKWKIQPAEAKKARPRRPSARDRLTVVSG
jgi:hypothetical protein